MISVSVSSLGLLGRDGKSGWEFPFGIFDILGY